MQAVLDELRGSESRVDGERLLGSLALTRRELEAAARLLDVRVSKEDDSARLREKIIQASVGARLGSRAVRGT